VPETNPTIPRAAKIVRNFMEHPAFLLILLGLFAVLFGGKRLPEAARGLGRSMRIFKSEVKQMREDDDDTKPAPGPLEGRVVDDGASSTTASLVDDPEPVRQPGEQRRGA
jgi:sec-independent protein translocase protein TatA